MIPANQVLSDPINAIAPFLFTHGEMIHIDSVRPNGIRHKDLEFLLEHAMDKMEQPAFQSNWERYKMYMLGDEGIEGVIDRLSELRNREIIFLDIGNLCLEDSQGRFARACVDDFSATSEVAKYFMQLYEEMDEPLQEFMRNIVFWRLGAFDHPFDINGNEEATWIQNPYSDTVSEINSYLIENKKRTFGDQVRYLGSAHSQSNYHFSPSMLSVTQLRKKAETVGFTEHGYQNFSRKYPSIPIEEYVRLREAATKINREIMILKYDYIINELELDNITTYMLQGDIGKSILDKLEIQTHVPGEKLLSNTKDMPMRGVLEPQALNRLGGYIAAKVSVGKKLIPAPIIKAKKYPALELSTASQSFIRTIGDSNLDDLLHEIPEDEFEALVQDTIDYGFKIDTIESILVRLNRGNFTAHTDYGETSWSNIIEGKLVVPYEIAHLSDPELVAQRSVRPSNSSSTCPQHKHINLYPEEFWKSKGMEPSAPTKSGIAMHRIATDLETNEYLNLAKFGLPPIQRSHYCEVPIAHKIKPSEQAMEMAESRLTSLAINTDNPFYKSMLGDLRDIDNIVITDGGQPDAMAKIEPDQVIVIDFKRRMYSFYPSTAIMKQMSRYFLVMNTLENLNADSFYAVIVQTPFTPNRFIQKELKYAGPRRQQKIRIQQITTDFLHATMTDMLLEYLGNRILKEDPRRGFELRLEFMYDKKGCSTCFANQPNMPQCNYLLTKRKQQWEEIDWTDIQ